MVAIVDIEKEVVDPYQKIWGCDWGDKWDNSIEAEVIRVERGIKVGNLDKKVSKIEYKK